MTGREPPGGAAPRCAATAGGAATRSPLPGAVSLSSSSRARQASRGPPSAYRIRSSAVRPGGPYRSRETRTSVRWPTTSRPRRIQARRLNSSRRAAIWAIAPVGRRQIRRLEHHQPDLGPTCQRRQSVQSLAQSGRGQTRATARLGRQIQQQQVHRSVLEEHRRHRQRLFQSVRREDDEPFQRHAPSRRLHRIQASPEVQVGGYSAGGLDPGDGPQPEGGLAARPVSLESGSGGSRQPAQPEDGIQRPKAAG